MDIEKARSTLPVWVVVSVCLLLAGCGSRGEDPAANGEQGWNLEAALGEGEVRAGQVTLPGELIGGPRARGLVGDYKLYNSRVEFIIRNPEFPGVGWLTHSGNLIDADWARPAGEPGQDCLWDFTTFFGVFRGFRGRAIEVLNDGRDGREAVIRVVGEDAGTQLIDGVVPTPAYHLHVTQDYILAPDVPYLRLRTTITSQESQARLFVAGDLPMWADKLANYTPGAGLEVEDIDPLRELRYVAGVNRIGVPVSYALATAGPDRALWVPYVDSEFLPCITMAETVAGNGSITLDRVFILGDGDTDLFDRTIRELDGATGTGVLEGRAQGGKAEDSGELQVHVRDASRPEGEDYAGIVWPGEGGAFAMELPPGDYTLVARAEGHPTPEPVTATVVAGETTRIDVPVGEPGYLHYEVMEPGVGPVPCKIGFQAGWDAAPDARLVHAIWSATGLGTEKVLPGRYTVTAARGYEYEIASENVEILPGGVTPFAALIARSVDTTGFLSGDFHIHSEFSVDSQLIAEHRVRCLLAEGIEMPVFTDHDFCADYAAIVRALGVEALLAPVTGNEISPDFGHTNAWPLAPPPGEPDYFGIQLVEYDEDGVVRKRNEFADLWDIARDRFGGRVIQVNHPRSGSAGWFNYVNYDRSVGVGPLDPAKWSAAFDALEVFNSGNWEENFGECLPDWFSLLNQGYRFTVTGNSDSHTADSTVGYPRNLFEMPTDDPGQAETADMVRSVLASNSVVSGGPFIRFAANGIHPIGSLVTDTDGETLLHVRVEAPSWMELNSVSLFANGEEVLGLDPVQGGTVRLDRDVPVTPEGDTWYAVLAEDTLHGLGPVNPGERIFAMTNPIWIDTDGNGVFDPPGLGRTAQ